jgi:Phage tail lysozyme
MATETIREFVAGLGFEVNESDQRRFYDAIEGATLRARLLGDALELMAKAAVGKIAEVATQFEALYNQAQRLGTTGPSIRAFEYAVRQVHGSVEGANAALESFGEFLKNLPPQAADNLAKQLKIPIEDTKDRAKFLLDIYERLSHMPNYLANQFRETYHLGGWSDFQQIVGDPQGAIKAFEEETKRQNAAGITDEAMRKQSDMVKKWLEFSQKMDDYSRQGELNLSGYAVKMLDILNKSIDEHEKKISEFVDWSTKFGFVTDLGKTQFHFDEAKFAEHFETALKAAESSTVLQLKHFEDALRPVVEWFERFGRSLFGIFTKPYLDQNGQPEVLPDASGGGFLGRMWGGIKGALGFGGGNKGVGGWWTPDRMSHAVDRLMKESGLSREGAAGLVARWAAVEAPGGPTSVNPNGAQGIGQWLGDRQNALTASGDFDKNLTAAINELNGRERAAGDALRSAKTPAEAERGASMFERAEGYNPSTGEDAYTGSTPVGDVLKAIDKRTAAAVAASMSPAGGPWVKANSKEYATDRFGNIHPEMVRPGSDKTSNLDWANPSAPGWAAINADLPVGPSSVDNSSRSVNAPITNNITVNSPDPQSAAAMVGVHLDRTANDVSRNLQGAFQ